MRMRGSRLGGKESGKLDKLMRIIGLVKERPTVKKYANNPKIGILFQMLLDSLLPLSNGLRSLRKF